MGPPRRLTITPPRRGKAPRRGIGVIGASVPASRRERSFHQRREGRARPAIRRSRSRESAHTLGRWVAASPGIGEGHTPWDGGCWAPTTSNRREAARADLRFPCNASHRQGLGRLRPSSRQRKSGGFQARYLAPGGRRGNPVLDPGTETKTIFLYKRFTELNYLHVLCNRPHALMATSTSSLNAGDHGFTTLACRVLANSRRTPPTLLCFCNMPRVCCFFTTRPPNPARSRRSADGASGRSTVSAC
jgi:hypothetical protein